MKPIPVETKSVCCYCGVGCGVIIESDGRQVTGVRGDPDHPANFGRLCSKGSTLHLTQEPQLLARTRALTPELRRDRKAPRRPAEWDETLDFLAQRFDRTIAEHGPDSVAFYISGQLLTEDYYVFNKLAKGMLGTNNIDTNSRLCMSSAVAAYKQTLGADAPPACYEDIDQAEVVFIAGSNMAYAHPVLYRRLADARVRNPAMKVIVADPRRTDTAADADLFLPLLPGTDIALFNGMLHICLWEDLIDQAFIDAHTEGFAALKNLVRDYTPKYVSAVCGIAEADLVQAARWFGASRASLSLYCQGLNQSAAGTANNAALINLHLATHQIGKPGAGPFSLTGQPNAMGGREVGGMANLLSGHRDLDDPQHRREVAALWGVPEVPAKPGKTAVDLFEAVRQGEIKILWIVCTNPAQSMPDQQRIREALQKAELVIVQEAYANTATTLYADVLLPASSWAEKDGTVTNSERRITRVRQAVAAPGLARADWRIAVDFAHALERLRSGGQTPQSPLFPYTDVEQIWNEHRASTRGRDLDIGGLSFALLEERGPQQWPFAQGAQSGAARLYLDGRFATANGRARFMPTAWQESAEPVNARFPLHLTSGRLRDQWHGMSRTGVLPRSFAHAPEPAILMQADDILRRGLRDGDLVRINSKRGELVLPVRASNEMRSGQSFIAMHWGQEYVSGTAADGARMHGVNTLFSPLYCPISEQPALKHAAIRVAAADLPLRLTVFGWAADGDAPGLQARLREYMGSFAYAACTLFGRERGGVLLRAAAGTAIDAALLAQIEALFGLGDARVLRYRDRRHGHARAVRVDQGTLQAVSLLGDIRAESWLRQYLEQQEPVDNLGPALLMASSAAPVKIKVRGRIVCNCFDIGENQIVEALAAADGNPAQRLQQVQNGLHCGINCGACLSELKMMALRAVPAA
ncbi:MAG: nitrate reductase [Herbaspirillum sp.]|nr:nitrate reductase [Herbaspirillum sp.]